MGAVRFDFPLSGRSFPEGPDGSDVQLSSTVKEPAKECTVSSDMFGSCVSQDSSLTVQWRKIQQIFKESKTPTSWS
jgi:hypothetical protein